MFKKINYKDLNHKQKESYNYQKVSAILADYGFITYRMFDDYHGADFHAVDINGKVIKVQLKGRFNVELKYLYKDLYIAFSDNQNWYLYPHDKLHEIVMNHSQGASKNGGRSIGYIPKWLESHLLKYKI